MQQLLPFILRNAGSLLVLDGGMLALWAFFFLPYFSIETLVGCAEWP